MYWLAVTELTYHWSPQEVTNEMRKWLLFQWFRLSIVRKFNLILMDRFYVLGLLISTSKNYMKKKPHFIAIYLYFWFKYDLGQKYYATQVRPDRGLNSWPPDHDSTLHVTDMSALTTQPSVTSSSFPLQADPHYRWIIIISGRNYMYDETVLP